MASSLWSPIPGGITAPAGFKASGIKAGLKASGKPDDIIAKMVEGRINKFCKENALLEQEYVKNPDMTINDVLVDAISKLGENISISRFSRFQLGECESSSSDSENSE